MQPCRELIAAAQAPLRGLLLEWKAFHHLGRDYIIWLFPSTKQKYLWNFSAFIIINTFFFPFSVQLLTYFGFQCHLKTPRCPQPSWPLISPHILFLLSSISPTRHVRCSMDLQQGDADLLPPGTSLHLSPLSSGGVTFSSLFFYLWPYKYHPAQGPTVTWLQEALQAVPKPSIRWSEEPSSWKSWEGTSGKGLFSHKS